MGGLHDRFHELRMGDAVENDEVVSEDECRKRGVRQVNNITGESAELKLLLGMVAAVSRHVTMAAVDHDHPASPRRHHGGGH